MILSKIGMIFGYPTPSSGARNVKWMIIKNMGTVQTIRGTFPVEEMEPSLLSPFSSSFIFFTAKFVSDNFP